MSTRVEKLLDLLKKNKDNLPSGLIHQLADAADGTPNGARLRCLSCTKDVAEAAIMCTVVWYRRSDEMNELMQSVMLAIAEHVSELIMVYDIHSQDDVNNVMTDTLLIARAFAEDACGVTRSDGSAAGDLPDNLSDIKSRRKKEAEEYEFRA